MPSVFSKAAEVVLWPLGIKRKRRSAPREVGENGEGGVIDNDGTWEVDPVHFVGVITGAALAWWAMGKFRPTSGTASLAVGQAAGTSTSSGALPRIALSEFFQLLRNGAITAVTYIADRPPAGALLVKTLPAAFAVSKPLSTLVPAGHAAVGNQLLETLLLPGCHQNLFEELRGKDIVFECAEMAAEAEPDMSKLSLLIDIGGLVASVAALAYLFRSSNEGSFTGRHLEDSLPDRADRRRPVTFDDVAGMESTKEELREVIAYLRNPNTFYALGAQPPRGILLAGPSGTGKTLLARAVAGEAGVTFLYASSAAFVEIYVGQGAKSIRQFFDQARQCAPCIVFLDELDAVGASRQFSANGGNQEYAQTLNQLLLELDGIESHSSLDGARAPTVVTIAATNRYDCLDEALVRPGRLDRIVMVGLPNVAERRATLEIHARKLRTENLDFEALARITDGSSGADLANLLNEAALLAARRQADAVRMEHLEEVLRKPRPQQKKDSNQGRAETWQIGRDSTMDSARASNVLEFLLRSLAAGSPSSVYNDID